MHLSELAEEKRQHHDSGDNRKLRWLKVDSSNAQPTACAINFMTHESGQNQKTESGEIHWQRAPAHPAVIDQTGDDKGEKSDHDPVRLFVPKFRSDWIFPHVSRAVDGDYAKDREREHDRHQQPIEPENFSEKRSHVISIRRSAEYIC